VEGSDGALYGTTSHGGANRSIDSAAGTVFRLNKDGSGYSVLYNFGSGFSDGWMPQAGLVEGNDGALYGTASIGGAVPFEDQSGVGSFGTLFKLNKDGSGYAVLHRFSGANGAHPLAPLILASDGMFYGTTSSGGGNFAGTVFKLNQSGTDYALVRSFDNGDGANPQAPLIQGSDGVLYGTTYSGGIYNVGTVFKLNRDGSGYRVLRSFSTTGRDGYWPQAGLLEGSDGALYGTTFFDSDDENGTVFKINKDGSGYSILRSFAGGNVGDGRNPQAGLIEARDGALYGTTFAGGAHESGTVFKLNKDGTGYSVVYSFSTDALPKAPLIQGRDGALYGTTEGVDRNPPSPGDFGTVFKVSPDGSGYSLLHSFGISSDDGVHPHAGLLQGSDGALYGTTGGWGEWGEIDATVFKLKEDGSGYSVLHRFASNDNPCCPRIGPSLFSLVEGRDGMLYGTTSSPGGTVFRLSKDGTDFSVVHSFGGNGRLWPSTPWAGLVQGTDGVLYGTTFGGGDLGFGTVFKLWPPETPDMTGVTFDAGSVMVSFAGTAGSRYQVHRSTDLINWTLLKTITMPPSGTYTNVDRTPPSGPGYFRAAWVP
jgi:uncharacterized repeat protein (TIGR03803 family)